MISPFTPVVVCLGGIHSFQKHTKWSPVKSNFKKPIETSSGNNFFVGFVVVFVWFLLYRSGDDQEVLFDQILMGQVDFPSPYWDNVSDSAKVGFIADDAFLSSIIPHASSQRMLFFHSAVFGMSHASPAAPVNSSGSPSVLPLDRCLSVRLQVVLKWTPSPYDVSHNRDTSSPYWSRKILSNFAWPTLLSF